MFRVIARLLLANTKKKNSFKKHLLKCNEKRLSNLIIINFNHEKFKY